MDFVKKIMLVFILAALQGCNFLGSTLAYTNVPANVPAKKSAINAANKADQPNTFLAPNKASFVLEEDRGQATEQQDKTLFVMALSGGGSRAAYWSAAAMLRMKSLYEVDLLEEVDAISSISGGSMAAAYYAISADSKTDDNFKTKKGNRPLWNESSIKKAMSKNFLARWFGSWFLPHNMIRYWLTAFDRTDIMAKTFSDNLFDSSRGHDFKLSDINPTRPNLIINSTVSSSAGFSNGFSFTQEDFQNKLCSDAKPYKVSRAVMSSAAFPAAFNSMTLRDFRDPDTENGCLTGKEGKKRRPAYMHVIDGGSHDNLGLRSALRFLQKNEAGYENIAVILIDAYTPPNGLSTNRANPRGLFDYFVDTNVMDSVNVLMDRNREEVINEMLDYLIKAEERRNKKVQFYHATFVNVRQDYSNLSIAEEDQDAPLRARLFDISTSLQIGKPGIAAIDEAVNRLFVWENPCLQKIAQMLGGKKMPLADKTVDDVYCNWTN